MTGWCPAGAGRRAPATPGRAGCWPIRRTGSDGPRRRGVGRARVAGMPDHRGVAALAGDAQPALAVVQGQLCVGVVDAIEAAAHAELALLLALGEVGELVQVAGAGQPLDAAGLGVIHRQVAVQGAGDLHRGLAAVFGDQLDVQAVGVGLDDRPRHQLGVQALQWREVQLDAFLVLVHGVEAPVGLARRAVHRTGAVLGLVGGVLVGEPRPAQRNAAADGAGQRLGRGRDPQPAAGHQGFLALIRAGSAGARSRVFGRVRERRR